MGEVQSLVAIVVWFPDFCFVWGDECMVSDILLFVYYLFMFLKQYLKRSRIGVVFGLFGQ